MAYYTHRKWWRYTTVKWSWPRIPKAGTTKSTFSFSSHTPKYIHALRDSFQCSYTTIYKHLLPSAWINTIYISEWGCFWTHKPSPLTPTIGALYTVFSLPPSVRILPSTQTNLIHSYNTDTFHCPHQLKLSTSCHTCEPTPLTPILWLSPITISWSYLTHTNQWTGCMHANLSGVVILGAEKQGVNFYRGSLYFHPLPL